MTVWTYQYLFGDVHLDEKRFGACLHFVQTKSDVDNGILLKDKICSFLGQKENLNVVQKKKKNNKKISVKKKCTNDDDWLEQQIALAKKEDTQIKMKKDKLLQDNCLKVTNKFIAISHKQKCRLVFNRLKEHSRSVSMIKFVLLQLILEWVKEARICLCTGPQSNAALDLFMDANLRKTYFYVRTTSQMRVVRHFLNISFRQRCSDLDWYEETTGKGYEWVVTQYTNMFKLRWSLSLQIKTSVDLFLQPNKIPFHIGKIMVPRNVSFYEHFQIGDCEIKMKIEEACEAMKELSCMIIERNFTDEEYVLFDKSLNLFIDEHCLSGEFSMTWTCSRDGIILLAGLSPDYRSSFVDLIKKILKKMIPSTSFANYLNQKILKYMFDEELITSRSVHPFLSVAGFGGIPDFLPNTNIDVSKYIFFCQ